MNALTRKDTIPKILKYLATQLIERAWLLSSYSRGEGNEDSEEAIITIEVI